MTSQRLSEAARLPEPLSFPTLVKDRETLLAIDKLRKAAWQADGEVPDFIAQQSILTDPHDGHAWHYAILELDGRPVAAARLCVHASAKEVPDPETLEGYFGLVTPPIASLTRLVVSQEYRGRELAQQLTDIRVAHADRLGCRTIIAAAEKESRIKSLQRAGFGIVGETRIRYLRKLPSYLLIKECQSPTGAEVEGRAFVD